MKPLEEVVQDFRSIEDEARRKQPEVQTEIEQAQRDIAEGKDSTGSALHDGLVVLYGKDLLRPDSEITANYEKVAEELKGKVGEPVVMIHRWVEHEGCSGFGDSRRPIVKKIITLGIISAEELEFDYEKGVCVLPVSSQASRGAKQLQIPNDPEGGLIVANHLRGFLRTPDLGTELGRKLNEDNPSLAEVSMPASPNMEANALVLAIGHDGIKKWLENDGFDTSNDFSDARRLCEELGIDPIEPVTEWQKHISSRY